MRPMISRVLLVIGHGREESLCHHLLRRLQVQLTELGIEHRTQDLLADGFDPVLRLSVGRENAEKVDPRRDPLTAAYQEAVCWADAYIMVHPVWWFSPPAILKGWVDRVLVDGVALRQSVDGPPEGLLPGRGALVVQTFKVNRLIDKIVFGSLSRRFWHRGVFLPVGIKKVSFFPIHSTRNIQEARLRRIEERLRRAVKTLVLK